MNKTITFQRSPDKFVVTEHMLKYFGVLQDIDDFQFNYFIKEKQKTDGKKKQYFYMKTPNCIDHWFIYYPESSGNVSMVFKGHSKIEGMYQELIVNEKRIELEKQRLSYGIMCLKFNGVLIDDLLHLIAIIDY